LLGSLVIIAGFLGIQFKIFADAVERGIRAAQGEAMPGEGLSGLPFIGNNSASGRGGARQQRQRGGQQPQQ
jgi:hypothetical protein